MKYIIDSFTERVHEHILSLDAIAKLESEGRIKVSRTRDFRIDECKPIDVDRELRIQKHINRIQMGEQNAGTEA